MNITTVGIDLAKNVFQVHGVDARGEVVLRRQLRREQVARYFVNLAPCLSGWKLVRVPITGAVRSSASGTRCG